ncbi:serine/threonine protein kinase, partial [Actinomadura adrarensis]
STPSQRPTGNALPDGFRLHEDPTGFTIAVPEGWSRPEKQGTSVFFRPPDRRGYIQVDQTDDPNDSALEDWQRYAPQARGRFPGYSEIKISPVTQGEPISDPDGDDAADWEWTYNSSSGRMHALNRGFVMNDTGYAILLVAPDDNWDQTLREMAPIYEFFTPKED